MKTIPPRLQGTDGIRREVALQSTFPGLSPQQVFAKHGVITEEFMERYAFAHARLALKKKSKTLARATCGRPSSTSNPWWSRNERTLLRLA